MEAGNDVLSASSSRSALPAEAIAVRVQVETGCSVSTARKAVLGLEAFLDACAESSEPLTPSPLVDAAWHAFILHTEAYAAYCESRYGAFIHHQPMPRNPGGYSRSRQVLARAVGLDPEIWPEIDAADCRSACGGQKLGE